MMPIAPLMIEHRLIERMIDVMNGSLYLLAVSSLVLFPSAQKTLHLCCM